jgi:hypothetical protein
MNQQLLVSGFCLAKLGLCYSDSIGLLATTCLAVYSAKRDQTKAIRNKIERSCGESMVRANSVHFAAKWQYASHLSIVYAFPTTVLSEANSCSVRLLRRLANIKR